MMFLRYAFVTRHRMSLTAVLRHRSSRLSCSHLRCLSKISPRSSLPLRCVVPAAAYRCTPACHVHSTAVDTTELVSEMKNLGKHLEITWNDTTASRYYSLWLRKNCHCPTCRHDNGQLLMPSFSLPTSLTVRTTKVHAGSQALHIGWNEEDHETILPLQWLKDNSYSTKALQEVSQKQDVSVFKGPIKEYHWQDLSKFEDKINSFLKDLNEDGVVLIKDTPLEVGQVCKTAEVVAPVQNTLYGKHFNVEATPNAINVAYTPVALELHMDIVYYQSPPGLQLLHCLQFDEQVEGGESIFLDSIHVAQEMQRHHPDLFETFTRVPATFQKIHFERENPAAFLYRKPHITVNPEGKITSVIWSPPFEGPLRVPEEDVEPYFEAYRKFSELINTSPLKVYHRLQPGECVVFNNIRILHARNAFVLNGGRRFLQGCYVNIDDFKNRVQVMHMKTGSGDVAKRVNNGDWS